MRSWSSAALVWTMLFCATSVADIVPTTSTETSTENSTTVTSSAVCTAPPTELTDFDVSKLFGQSHFWYMWASSADDGKQLCYSVEIASDSGRYHAILGLWMVVPLWTDSYSFHEMYLEYENQAKLRGAMCAMKTNGVPQCRHVWVVATDYSNYVLGKTCDDSTGTAMEMWFALASKRSVDQKYRDDVTNALTIAGVDPATLQEIPQDRCPDVPPAKFCPSPALVEGFDIRKYSGSWHDVKATPGASLQEGCPTHVFSTTSYTVAYFEKTYDKETNSYRSQLGGVHPAEAVVGPRLVVTSPALKMTQQDYWILDTDYVTYSVVYSCTDDDVGMPRETVRVLGRDFRLGAPARDAVQRALARLHRRGALDPNDLADSCDPACKPDTCPPVTSAAVELDMVQFGGPWYARMRLNDDAACELFLHTETGNSSLFVTRADTNSVAPPAVREVVPVAMYSLDGRYAGVWAPPAAQYLAQYTVLGAQYDSWAVVSYCTEEPGAPAVSNTVILSRSAFADALPKDVQSVLHKHDLDYDDFEKGWQYCSSPKCLPEPVPKDAGLQWSKGDWYVMEETRNASSGICTQHSFSTFGGRSVLFVSQWDPRYRNHSSRAYELIQNKQYLRKFTTKSHATPADVFGDFWILDTDYDSYAVAYSCTDQDGGRSKARTWILTREAGKLLDRDSASRVYDALIHGHVDVRGLDDVEHPAFCGTLDPTAAPPPSPPNAAAAPPSQPARLQAAALVLLVVAVGCGPEA